MGENDPNFELLAYRMKQMEQRLDVLTGTVGQLRDALTSQKAARGALIGAAGILGGVVAFLGDVIFRLFNR
jgi:hypothetical protein